MTKYLVRFKQVLCPLAELDVKLEKKFLSLNREAAYKQ